MSSLLEIDCGSRLRFLAFYSATALSPADTMPLTQRAKLMTMARASLSMLIIVLLGSQLYFIMPGNRFHFG